MLLSLVVEVVVEPAYKRERNDNLIRREIWAVFSPDLKARRRMGLSRDDGIKESIIYCMRSRAALYRMRT